MQDLKTGFYNFEEVRVRNVKKMLCYGIETSFTYLFYLRINLNSDHNIILKLFSIPTSPPQTAYI